MKFNHIFAIILTATAICGCKKNSAYVTNPSKEIPVANITPGKESTLFPLQVGNQWVYNVNLIGQSRQGASTKTSEVTLRVISVENVAGGKKAVVEAKVEGNAPEKQVWLVDGKGIWQLSAGPTLTPYSQPKPMCTFPIKSEHKFSWSGSANSTTTKLSGTILAPQEIDTEHKRVSAIPVETTEVWQTDGRMRQTVMTYWWAPEIGIARLLQSDAAKNGVAQQQWILKSYNLKP